MLRSSLLATDREGKESFIHDNVPDAIVGGELARRFNEGELEFSTAFSNVPGLMGIVREARSDGSYKYRTAGDLGRFIIYRIQSGTGIQGVINYLKKEELYEMPIHWMYWLSKNFREVPPKSELGKAIEASLEEIILNPKDPRSLRALAFAAGHIGIGAKYLIFGIEQEKDSSFREEYLTFLSSMSDEDYEKGLRAYYAPLIEFGKKRGYYLEHKGEVPTKPDVFYAREEKNPRVAARTILEILSNVRTDEEGMVVYRLAGHLAQAVRTDPLLKELWNTPGDSHPIIHELMEIIRKRDKYEIDDPLLRAPTSALRLIFNSEDKLAEIAHSLKNNGRQALAEEWIEEIYRRDSSRDDWPDGNEEKRIYEKFRIE